MKNATILGSFISGLLTFFSPCILPLIPIYFSMLLGGVEYKSVKRGEVIFRTLLFIMGFGFIFIALGLTSTIFGRYLSENIFYFKKIAGVLIIILALFLMDIINLKLLLKTRKINIKFNATYSSNFLLGIAFGFAWTPCVGPILGSILILASTTGKLLNGLILLFVYTVGLAIPFLMISFLGENLLVKIKLLTKYSHIVKIISGIILIVFGLLIIANKL